jgi:succinate dehydrogenase / fumarate reductase membrane anchor subunit
MVERSSVLKSHEGTWLWLYKMIAGGLIIVLLGVHFVVNHLVAPEGLLTYNDVLRYYTNPIVPVMEVLFLIFVISHALIGLRSIILDLNPTTKLLRTIDTVFIIAGVVFTIYGIWLVVVIVQRGMSL